MQREAGNCPVYKKCSGCQLRNMTYEEQLGFKERKVIGLLGKFCHVEPIIGMDCPYHYRNKVQAAFGSTKSGKLISGVYQSASRGITVVDDCLINNQDADRIIVTIRKLAKSFKIDAYNEYTGRGTIRHVLVRRGFYSRQILVAIVCASPIFPHKAKFIEELIKIHPEITTVVMDVNKNGLNLTLGGNETVLYGNGYIEDTLCGYTFKITAGSFYQVNTQQTEVLYDCAIKLAGLTGREKVLDAYCGVGTIGIISSEFAKEVKAVELNGEAVKNAIDNARINDINNISFYRGDAGKFMVDMSAKGEKFDVVFMDPPRAGSSKEFLSALVRTCPKKVIYISCNPQTQKRDIEFLVRNKYRVKNIQPVDMFPHTSHVECAAELRLAKSAQI